jgi:predicted transcriptional regulator
MVKRLTVTLDDELHDKLELIAKEQERTVPNLLAYLGREAVKQWEAKHQDKKQGK